MTTTLADLFPPQSRRWARRVISAEQWLGLADRLESGAFTLVAHWAEPPLVHVALRDAAGSTGIFSVEAVDGRFPSLGGASRPARRLERTIRDLTGLEPEGAPDLRPWLDHGRDERGAARPYAFLPVDGEGLHQIAVGPVHAGIIEPGHFRFTAAGETIVRLEQRLGYVHKGLEGLMAGAPLERGARLAARACGDSTVAYSLAFAQAVEAACGVVVPPRAVALRAVMAEFERLANHLGDIGGICNDAAFSLMLTHCAILRERILRTCALLFGHRLMMDGVVPGGVSCDLAGAGEAALARLFKRIDNMLPALFALYEDTASLQDRTVRTGIVLYSLAKEFGAGGPVGRASGRPFDARRDVPYAPYDSMAFEVPVLERGDVDARVRLRFREAEQSAALLRRLLAALPAGPLRAEVPAREGEGAALVEGFRGDIFAWVRLAGDGRLAHAHLRDPSWFQWPLLEAAIEGAIVADFPLCNKSFNCAYAGHDL
ncbi:MAG: NADH-quinone oxidoreductase subunit C [Alphaproteobacteria bacterium]|nr:NADH-quinone oxidoreductase subunit C [Alphaproteobacteria bacterium]